MTALLLVEDHAALADSLVYFLRTKGAFEVAAVAHSAEAALGLLVDISIDLALVDVSLPDMSGIDLVGVILERYPDFPCLMLSGHVDRTYVDRALAIGARGYVTKGNPVALIAAINVVLGGEIFISPELLTETQDSASPLS